jgi:aminocarboxymuconate-semialdehyde decarboxylase
MKSIDIHAHSTPQCFQRDVLKGKKWHNMTSEEGELHNPRNAWSPEERIADMNSIGMDVQVVSTTPAFYKYDEDLNTAVAIAKDCNNEIRQMTMDYPDRLAGLGMVPMQDIPAAIAEMERAVVKLGFKGVMIDDKVNGKTYDEPEFLPFFKAAEQMGAFILIHQAYPNVVHQRINRYHLPNSIGNLADRTITFASMVFGGVMDQCPDLKICLCHGGGYTCFVIGRMDRGWRVRSEARQFIQKPPSAYLRSFYYDCLTQSEPALRYLIDTVGADRVVMGTDWPADMCTDWPVSNLLEMNSLTQEEKDLILWKNLERLLGL